MARNGGLIKSFSVGATGAQFGIKEQNDCVVRAFANVTGMPYIEAYEIFERAGRKCGQGTATSIYAPIYAKYNIKPKAAFGTTSRALWYKSYYKIPHLRGCTLGSMLKSGVLDNGKFIVAVDGHHFAVIDNEIIDKGYNRLGMSVTCVFQLEE